jgi:hypothetical protein
MPNLAETRKETVKGRNETYGQRASGGRDIKIASTFPPVFNPNCVPRS